MNRCRLYISKLLCFALVLGLFLAPAPVARAAEHPFKDLSGSQYEKVVTALWELGVVTGLEPDQFVPGGPVTRAQMAALIMRAIGRASEAETLKDTPSGFSDVPLGHWASGVITLASRAGVIKGDAGKFFPNDPVNYAQAATMVVRALGYEGQVVGGYPAGYVLKANELSLLKGLTFELYGGVTRAEAATLLYNAIFMAPVAGTQATLSQSHFKRATALQFGSLPQYVAPGQLVQLSANATDRIGSPITGATVGYKILSGAGSIQGSVLTIGNTGPIVVQAASGKLEATGTLAVADSLSVSPETFQASKGGSVQLSATALLNGQRVNVQPQWKIVQGPATVSEAGLVTVNDYGNVTVQAALGSLSAVTTGQAVGKVAIVSKPEFFIPGLSYDFAALVLDSAGKTLSVPVTWSATGATINSTTGRLTNLTGNQVTVRATTAGISDEATIPVLKSVAITPGNAGVLANKTVSFTAKGIDSAGKQYDLKPRWDRTNAAVGIIDVDGTFVGTNAGSTEITATVGTLVGRTQLQVSGMPARLSIATEHATVPTAGRTTVTVKLLDQAGNVSPVSDQPISLGLTDTNKGALSKTVALTQDGVATVTFTASSSAGLVTITAAAPGTTLANQTVTVSSYVPVPTHIQLTATPQPLATGGGVATIGATLRDANGFPAPAPQSLYVTLSASSTSFGSLTGTTITIPAGQTGGVLSFISSGAAGTVQINGASTYPVRNVAIQTAPAGPATGVQIRPITSATPVTGLSTLMVQVDVLDAGKVQRANDNTTRVQLVVSGLTGFQGTQPIPSATYTETASGGVATFQIPAYAVGTATLTASLPDMQGTTTDSARAEFVPGVFSSIRLSVQPASLVADGFGQAQITAEVVDSSGTVLTAINPVVTFRKLTDAGSTAALTSTSVQAVNGRALLTVQTTRAPGSDVWYATAPGMETQNLATLTTRSSSGDAYTLRVIGSTSFAPGAANTLIVQVVDQQGQLVTTDSGRTITATTTMAGVTFTPSTATTQNGLATFTVVGSQTTSGVASFTTTGLPISVTTSTVIFTPGGAGSTGTPYSLYASANTLTARVGVSITIWVRIMDIQGNVLSNENGRTVTAAVNGNASISSPSATTVGGVATFTVTGLTAGTATVTVTNLGLPQPQTTLTLTITN